MSAGMFRDTLAMCLYHVTPPFIRRLFCHHLYARRKPAAPPAPLERHTHTHTPRLTSHTIRFIAATAYAITTLRRRYLRHKIATPLRLRRRWTEGCLLRPLQDMLKS